MLMGDYQRDLRLGRFRPGPAVTRPDDRIHRSTTLEAAIASATFRIPSVAAPRYRRPGRAATPA
jgi:hypothetical protein